MPRSFLLIASSNEPHLSKLDAFERILNATPTFIEPNELEWTYQELFHPALVQDYTLHNALLSVLLENLNPELHQRTFWRALKKAPDNYVLCRRSARASFAQVPVC